MGFFRTLRSISKKKSDRNKLVAVTAREPELRALFGQLQDYIQVGQMKQASGHMLVNSQVLWVLVPCRSSSCLQPQRGVHNHTSSYCTAMRSSAGQWCCGCR